MVFLIHFRNVRNLWNPEMRGELKFQASCPHNTQTKAWNLRPEMSLRAETINGRMNDLLITTPTKPAEHYPWGAKGVQLSVTAQQCFIPYGLIQISNFICRVPISSVLNIAFVNNLRIWGHMCATQSPTQHWKEGKYTFKLQFTSKASLLTSMLTLDSSLSSVLKHLIYALRSL